MTKQKECVYQVVTSNPGKSKSEWAEILTVMAWEGEMEFTAESKLKYDTVDKVRTYCRGLLSNWLRKDVRLGGAKPTPKLKQPTSEPKPLCHLKLVD